MHPHAFALPNERRYPIHDAYHAELALTHLLRSAGRHGANPGVARKVLAAVNKRWPNVVSCHVDLVAKIRKAHGIK
jgi:hypothetical protein